MGLSHQSLGNFDTFINFAQFYLLTIKPGTGHALRLCLFGGDVFVGKGAETGLSLHPGTLTAITPSTARESVDS